MQEQKPIFYTLKAGETIMGARRRWMTFNIYELSRKMGSKTQPGVEYITTVLKVLERFADNVIWTFFEEAPTKFKYFPKPVEIKDGLHEIDKAIKKRDFVNKPISPPQEAEKHPWPNNLIGLIMGFDDPRGVSTFGLKSTGIDIDEAKYLYDKWRLKEWTDPWAIEIVGKSQNRWEMIFKAKEPVFVSEQAINL